MIFCVLVIFKEVVNALKIDILMRNVHL